VEATALQRLQIQDFQKKFMLKAMQINSTQ
jgi:hypothetical protein